MNKLEVVGYLYHDDTYCTQCVPNDLDTNKVTALLRGAANAKGYACSICCDVLVDAEPTECHDCGKKLNGTYVRCVVCDKAICDVCDVRAEGVYEEPHCTEHRHPINHLPLDCNREGWIFNARIELFLPDGQEEDVSWRQEWMSETLRTIPGVIDWRYSRQDDVEVPEVAEVTVITAGLGPENFRKYMLRECTAGLSAISVSNGRPVRVEAGYQEDDFLVKVLG